MNDYYGEYFIRDNINIICVLTDFEPHFYNNGSDKKKYVYFSGISDELSEMSNSFSLLFERFLYI